ncbi:Hypothetical_protein [Hexamita inflata]|uniref:Hypothetical_protein n=1 Tax=Hexamita inflata TaxID=28002 RepID=A0AA86NIY2_9EUKA|nr:Hypothetical protein HINF_LOCUS7796 [Hexamita inflata]
MSLLMESFKAVILANNLQPTLRTSGLSFVPTQTSKIILLSTILLMVFKISKQSLPFCILPSGQTQSYPSNKNEFEQTREVYFMTPLFKDYKHNPYAQQRSLHSEQSSVIDPVIYIKLIPQNTERASFVHTNIDCAYIFVVLVTMHIIFPFWLPVKYPEILHSLQSNSNLSVLYINPPNQSPLNLNQTFTLLIFKQFKPFKTKLDIVEPEHMNIYLELDVFTLHDKQIRAPKSMLCVKFTDNFEFNISILLFTKPNKANDGMDSVEILQLIQYLLTDSVYKLK